MLSKLASRNTRKSFGDFAVYFLTLMFGVAAFYAFGSIGQQSAMSDLKTLKPENLKIIASAMDVMSVLVAMVLAFLVTYANGFLIKRRKREFGTYLMLGMPKRQVGAILLMETLLVGLLAMGAGLALGIVGSQGLSLLTARMFEIDMTEYRFVFSFDSLIKTVGFFGLLFLVVSVLNLLGFSRQSVSRLLNASKRAEPRVRNPVVSVSLAIVGLVLSVGACWAVLELGLIESMSGPMFWLEIAAGVLGTLLLFAGGSGLALRALQASEGTYFRGLNPFVIRQLDSKVNSTYLTMATVCITMLFAIVILSSGISFGNVLNRKTDIPYDASFVRYDDAPSESVVQGLRAAGFNTERYFAVSHEYNVYWSTVTPEDIVGDLARAAKWGTYEMQAIGESDANALLRLQGKPELDLGDDGFALMGPLRTLERAMQARYPSATVRMGNHSLRAVTGGLVDSMIDVSPFPTVTLVVPDAIVEPESIYTTVLDVTYRGDVEQAEVAIMSLGSPENPKGVFAKGEQPQRYPFTSVSTKVAVLGQQLGTRVIVTYIGLYVGLILLVTSVAILALQQLSEATDNRDRYKTLSKIGASDKMMSRAVFTQVAVYFGVPLVVALGYSLVGGKVILDVIRMFGQVDVMTEYSLAVVVLVLVFGAYFVATAYAARRIALEK